MGIWIQNSWQFSLALLLSVPIVYGAAVWSLKKYSEKWIGNKFAKNLEDHKHALQSEADKIRLELNKLMDRATQFHQREYDEMQRVWHSLCAAVNAATPSVTLTQLPPIELDNLDDDSINTLLADEGFEDFQRALYFGAPKENRADIYRIIDISNKSAQGFDAHDEFRATLMSARIFISKDIIEKFVAIDGHLSRALYEVSETGTSILIGEGKESFAAREVFSQTGRKLIAELGEQIHGRLSPSDPETHP